MTRRWLSRWRSALRAIMLAPLLSCGHLRPAPCPQPEGRQVLSCFTIVTKGDLQSTFCSEAPGTCVRALAAATDYHEALGITAVSECQRLEVAVTKEPDAPAAVTK